LLSTLEQELIDPGFRPPSAPQIIELMVAYARQQMAPGGLRLHAITRHMHGVMAGRDGARAWRRFLSELATRPESPPEALFAGLPIVKQGIAA
jgi:tRNA-dihydrouridine synthase A